MTTSPAVLQQTRRSLHAVAELVLAGPQHRTSGTIKLGVTPAGFGTVATPRLRVMGDEVASDHGVHPISGHTPRSLASLAGVQARTLAEVYSDGSGASLDDQLVVDTGAARQICAAFATADEALRLLAPDVEPILWPEHFDIGIRLVDINFGVSPGDAYLAVPYAYVGVDPVPADPFWNAPFGRTAVLTDFVDAVALRDFFADGRDHRAG